MSHNSKYYVKKIKKKDSAGLPKISNFFTRPDDSISSGICTTTSSTCEQSSSSHGNEVQHQVDQEVESKEDQSEDSERRLVVSIPSESQRLSVDHDVREHLESNSESHSKVHIEKLKVSPIDQRTFCLHKYEAQHRWL